jgi:hypothetical protein
MSLDLRGLPEKFCIVLRRLLADEHCTPDTVLFIAEKLENLVAECPPTDSMIPSIKRLVADLRDKAPEYDRHV